MMKRIVEVVGEALVRRMRVLPNLVEVIEIGIIKGDQKKVVEIEIGIEKKTEIETEIETGIVIGKENGATLMMKMIVLEAARNKKLPPLLTMIMLLLSMIRRDAVGAMVVVIVEIKLLLGIIPQLKGQE